MAAVRAFSACSSLLIGSALLFLGCGGGGGANSLNAAPVATPGATVLQSIASQSLLVTDSANCRVLVFTPALASAPLAVLVLGQPDFSGFMPGTAADHLNHTESAVIDSQGNIWVSDYSNRVLEFKVPFTSGMSASLVLGQQDFTSNALAYSANGMADPHGLAFDRSGNLWVADSYNDRILEFSPPFSNGMTASMILGAVPGFGTGACTSPNRGGLCYPWDLSFDSSGNLWVVDSGNNRVVRYTTPLSTGQVPSLAIGQPDLNSQSLGGGATGLNLPLGIALDAAGNLWVADRLNNRVLEFTPPFNTGQAVTLIIGSGTLSNPTGLAFDAKGNLSVVDTLNQRVLLYSPPFSAGMSPSATIGQKFSTGTSTSLLGIPLGVSIAP